MDSPIAIHDLSARIAAMTSEDLTPSTEKSTGEAPSEKKSVARNSVPKAERGETEPAKSKKKASPKKEARKAPVKLEGEVLTPVSEKKEAPAPEKTEREARPPKSEEKRPEEKRPEERKKEETEMPQPLVEGATSDLSFAPGEDAQGGEGSDRRARNRNRRGNRAAREERPQQPREVAAVAPVHDPTELAKMAWQIYSKEIEEDGMGIMTDKDALKFARRSFELSRLFLEERARQGVYLKHKKHN